MTKHLRELAAGKHSNRHLQSAYECGQRFAIDVLEYCDDESQLVEREQSHIDRLRTADNAFGYNLTIAGRTIPSEEGRKRISAVRRGKTWEEIHGPDKAAVLRANLRQRFAGEGNPHFDVNKDRSVKVKTPKRLSESHRAAIAKGLAKARAEGRGPVTKTRKETSEKIRKTLKRRYDNGELELTDAQRRARQENARRLNQRGVPE